MSGRPLRFLAVAVIGWTALRTAMLWPAAKVDSAVPPPRTASLDARPITPAGPGQLLQTVAQTTSAQPEFSRVRISPEAHARLEETDLPGVPISSVNDPKAPASDIRDISSVNGGPQAPSRRVSRWSASVWLLLREGKGVAPGLTTGQLGGGQGGIRLAYAIDQARRLSLVGRLVSPVAGKGREAAIGIEWRPTRLPVRVVAERRFSLDGGKGGPLIGLVGGSGPAPVASGFDLETYGEAGVIRRSRTEPFADGAVRVTHPVGHLGKTKVDLGLGSWGGAQRGAQRLDIGPALGLRVPVAGHSIRVAVDWRERVAGRARPGSGPSLTIGADF